MPARERAPLPPFLLALAMLAWPLAAQTPDGPPAVEEPGVEWRWIGLAGEGVRDCPRPHAESGWEVSHLFEDEEGAALIPPALRPFCVYEHPRPGPAQLAALEALRTGGKLSELEPDMMAVLPMAPATAPQSPAGPHGVLAGLLWEPLRDHFREQAGHADFPLTGATPVRLAVLDTQPTGPAPDAASYAGGESLHGFTLINMAGDFLCSGGLNQCLARVSSRLALPFEGYARTERVRRNLSEGGFLGLIGEQARNVWLEVQAWRRAARGSALGRPPMVLNLSFAWDRRFGGLEPSADQMPLPVRAVYRALEGSSCLGVLTVAAAGNHDGGPAPEVGPPLPAAWEARDAADADACRKLFRVSPPAGGATYRPLLYAAGGVRADGSPLANVRPGGLPKTVAFADHAVVESRQPGTPTATLTGSSVSALVVSSTAAAVWYYRPRLSAHEVMEIVYQAGDDLGAPAEFCLGGTPKRPCPAPAPTLRRVSVCQAVAAACRASEGACPPFPKLPACPAWPAGPPDLAKVDFDPFDGDPSTLKIDLQDFYPPEPAPDCGGEIVLFRKEHAPKNPCPHRQYSGLWSSAWTKPQPESNPCPNCSIRYASPGTLRIEIGRFRGTLSDATLKVGSTSYALGLSSLDEGDRILIENVPEDDGESVVLTFSVDGESSVTSPLLLVHAAP